MVSFVQYNVSFFVGNKMIDNVDRFSHLGHIITSSLLDGNDIVQRRNTFVGQTENVLYYFIKLNTMVKLSFLKSYCTGIYGTELWALDSAILRPSVLRGVKLSGIYNNYHTTPIRTFFII